MGIIDLSSFQLFKIPYLIQIFSLKYAGTKFVSDAVFVRDQNGPISIDIYSAVERLEKKGYIKKEVKENKDYKKPRHCHSLAKKIPRLNFTKGEEIFLDNFDCITYAIFHLCRQLDIKQSLICPQGQRKWKLLQDYCN